MFYLTYRPQKIADIDNSVIREKLTKILSQKSLPHALLFSGPKGVGKTSSARIVAKAVNCRSNLFGDKSQNSIEPCNTCDMCVSISQGTALDIIEIDAASNRKIDEIRDLISQVKFSPVTAKYKIYIIDEVHMLTTEAFNALLKTLEEPPAYTIFILATTETDKLPKTIVSRCIHFNFGKAKKEELVQMLKRIVKKENIAIDDTALEYIADRADFSFRDGAKLLEEATSEKAFTVDALKKMFGLTNQKEDLLKLIDELDMINTISYLKSYDENGGSFKTLIESLLETLHDVLLAKTIEQKAEYSMNIKQIGQLIKLLQEAYATLRFSPIESLPLEVALIEYFTTYKK